MQGKSDKARTVNYPDGGLTEHFNIQLNYYNKNKMSTRHQQLCTHNLGVLGESRWMASNVKTLSRQRRRISAYDTLS